MCAACEEEEHCCGVEALRAVDSVEVRDTIAIRSRSCLLRRKWCCAVRAYCSVDGTIGGNRALCIWQYPEDAPVV
jgi:hypothetical protein